jgi:hypothetical protein
VTVQEVVQGLGSWSITLTAETPKEITDRLGYFGHIAIFAGRVNPQEYRDNLLTQGRYVGVVTAKVMDDELKKLSGQGMELWLGDSDEKGEIFETPLNITGQSFANSIRAALGSGTAVIEGILHAVAGTYSGTHVWQNRRQAVQYVCQLFGAEYRVNGNATLDAGTQAQLYRATPVCAIVRKGLAGRDLSLSALPGDLELSQDVKDFTTRVVLLAEGQGDATATGSANISSNPYLDLRGQPIKRTRLVSESGTTTGNAGARAQLQLNRFTGTKNALRLSTEDYELDGSFRPGDMVWVYDPDAGLLDLNNEITFRGQRINPIALRTVEASWPVTEGMTVAYRHQDGTWYDLTDYVKFEAGATAIGVGELGRSLTSSGFEPVGPRPIPDTTIPGVVTWVLPFGSSVYLDALGNTRASILASWNLPLNSDGSTILDGHHYELRYGLSPASEWQIAYAPWSDLQVVVNDLSPGVEYDFQIRAVDSSNNAGAWSATETVLANPDTIPPSTPAPPTVAGSRLAIQIRHELGKASGGTFNLELDLDHLEVHVGAASGFTPDDTTLKGKVSAHAGMIAAGIPAIGTVEVEETTVRHVKVIAVDQAGNRSSPSAAATATALLIDSAHISDLTASKITAGSILADLTIAARIKTADTGARTEISTAGLQMFNGSNTALVSLQSNGVFFLRSGTTGARLDFSNVSGIQLYDASGTRTVWLDLDGSFELRSAASGARIQLDGTGFKAFNAGGTQTVDITSSGTVSLIGQLASGTSGRRIVVSPTGASIPEIRFYGSDGTTYASIQAPIATGVFDPSIVIRPSSTSPVDTNIRVGSGNVRMMADTSYALVDNSAVLLNTSTGHFQVGFGDAALIVDDQIIFNAPGGFSVNGNPKTFIIDHPLDRDRWLVHATTESPHAGVEYWGEVTLGEGGHAVVDLPSYFEALTAVEGRIVLTGNGPCSTSYPKDGRFTVRGAAGERVFWLVKAIRKDVPPLVVEPRRNEINVYGDGPYRYSTPKETTR